MIEPLADERRRAQLTARAPSGLRQKLRAARLSGERKRVTAVFADLVGSTALAEAMDPEDWAALINQVMEILSEAVFRYEGTIARLVGDGLLAFFGAPLAHEDDPERAARAAMDMIGQIRGLSTELADYGIEVAIRVGINTGDVVVGRVGSDLRYDYTALGDAVNVAERMQEAADPGQIVITEETYRFVAPLVEARALPPVSAQGKAQRVAAYELVGLSPTPGRLRGLPGRQSPMLGRGDELAALQQALEGRGAQRACRVIITGEPGIGKSRLLHELRAWTARADAQQGQQGQRSLGRPVRWAEGRCLSYGQNLPYHLLLHLVRDLLDVPPQDEPRAVEAPLAQRLGPAAGDAADEDFTSLAHLLDLPLDDQTARRLDGLAPSTLQARYREALRHLLRVTAGSARLVLVFEDVHWIDPSSAQLLTRLLPVIGDIAPLILVTTRPDRSQAAEQLLTELRGSDREGLIEVRLTPLPDADSRQLAAHLLDRTPMPENLRRLVVRRSEGNPLFLEELVRTLVEGGENAAADIPDTLQGLLLARIDRLPDESKRTAKVAAVIGRQFPLRVLEEVAGGAPELAALEDAGVVEAVGTPEEGHGLAAEYTFRHALLQEAAYESLLRQERQGLHARVGEALERLYPDRRGELAAVLADHFDKAGDAARARDYLITAGQRALQRFADREALGFFERAEALLTGDAEEEDPGHRAAALLGLGEAQRRVLDPDQARRTFLKAGELAREAGLARQLAEAALGYGRAAEVWGTNETLIGLLRTAQDLLGDMGPLAARVRGRLAQALYFRDPAARAEALRAERVARESGEEAALADVLLARRPLLGPDDLAERLRVDAEVVDVAERLGDWDRAAQAHAWRLVDVLELGDAAAAGAEMAAHLRLARQLRQPLHLRDAAAWQALQAMLHGRFDDADRDLRETRRLGIEAGDEETTAVICATLIGSLALLRGRREDFREAAEGYASGAQKYPAVPAWRAGLVALLAMAGEHRRARPIFEELAESDFAGIPHDSVLLVSLSQLAHACALFEDRARAARLADLLLPYAGHVVVVDRAFGCLGSVSYYLARLEALLGRSTDAERRYQEAVVQHGRLQSPPLVRLAQDGLTRVRPA